MVNGLHTSSRSMQILQSKLDNTSNNLANANTSGFKKSLMATHARVDIGRNDQYKLHQDEHQKLSVNYVNHEQGALVATDDPFDLAIEGTGFFELDTPGGKRFSRNGAMTVNNFGELVNLNGYPVLDDTGAKIFINGDQFAVSSDGVVTVDGQRQGRLSLKVPHDIQDFERIGTTLFELKEGAKPPDEQGNGRISQGMLEGSNVNVVDSMVQMIAIQAQYDSNSTAMRSIDETLTKAVNDVGRVG